MAGNYNIFFISEVPLYTREELLVINDTIQNSNMKQSEPKKFGADGANKKSKVSVVPWIELKSCLKKFEKFIFDANNDFFNYDIIPISDFHYININEYDKKYNSYDWHIDSNVYGSMEDLKLTCLLNISTETYSGGKLHLSGAEDKGEDIIFKNFNKPGYALIFTAYRMHKVESITKGKRKTLSYWAKGPAWR